MTEWKIFKKINKDTIKNMKRKFIIDSRRMLVEKNLDADYNALGLGK